MSLWSAQWRPVIDSRGFVVVFSTDWHGCLLQVQDLFDSTTPLADTAPHVRHRPLCVTWPDQQGHVWRFRAGFNCWTQPSLALPFEMQSTSGACQA